jgi:hypothetical protein
MNSYDVQDHGATGQVNGQAKRPWVTPSLQIILLKSAEAGSSHHAQDSSGSHFTRPKS